jgi:hypothetical protein
MSDSSEAPAFTTVELFPFRVLGVVFGITALLILFVGLRLGQRGRWLPDVPPEINGVWTVAEKPLSHADLDQLGFPSTRGWLYKNLFNEEVEVQLISTSSFESYLDPKIAMSIYGLSLTAERQYSLFGADGPVRAVILRSPGGQRTLLYYWVQNKNGRTNAKDSLKQSRDFLPRLRLGLGATLDGTQNCIVRAFVKIHPADNQGLQARRNLNEVCLKIHDAVVRQGAGRP